MVQQEQRVGVLFVHGIGSQPQSETLRHFAGPLIDWLSLWHAERGLDDPTTGFHVLKSHLVLDQSVERPSWVALKLPASRQPDPAVYYSPARLTRFGLD